MADTLHLVDFAKPGPDPEHLQMLHENLQDARKELRAIADNLIVWSGPIWNPELSDNLRQLALMLVQTSEVCLGAMIAKNFETLTTCEGRKL